MGFDLHVQRVREDGDSHYPRVVAEAIFDRGALRPSDLECVEYPDGRGEIFCGRDGTMIDGFMLSHFGGRTICDRVIEIAAVTQSLILWPGSTVFSAVMDREVIARLPLDARTSLGEIALIATVEDLWAAIHRGG